MDKPKERIEYIDVARGIAMICIILGHLRINEITRVVFTFHVPIFFLITGYFTSTKLKVKDFIVKKYRTCIVPYIITCIVIIILGTLIGLFTDGVIGMMKNFLFWISASMYGSGSHFEKPFEILPIGAIWFLLATFWGSLFFRISLNMNQKNRLIFVMIVFLIGYYTKKICWFPFSIQAGCCATLYMYIGHFYKEQESNINKIPKLLKILIVIGAFIIWLLFIKNFESFWLVEFNIGRGAIDIFGSLCACLSMFEISKFIDLKLKHIGNFLKFIGKNSVFMLCIHIVELNLFPWGYLLVKLVNLGMSKKLNLEIVILGKMILNILGTYILSKYVEANAKNQVILTNEKI